MLFLQACFSGAGYVVESNYESRLGRQKGKQRAVRHADI